MIFGLPNYMSFASRVLARRPLGPAVATPLRCCVSSPLVKHFATAKEPCRPKEVDRACGVPETATEAGPKDVGGIMRPGFFLIACGAIVGLAAFVFLAPSSGTRTGEAMQKHIREERAAVERARGDGEEDETPRMRKLELMEIEDAKREKALKERSHK